MKLNSFASLKLKLSFKELFQNNQVFSLTKSTDIIMVISFIKKLTYLDAVSEMIEKARALSVRIRLILGSNFDHIGLQKRTFSHSLQT